MSRTKRIYELTEELDDLPIDKFRSLIIDILNDKSIIAEPYAGGKDYGIDIIANEYSEGQEIKWLVEIKKADIISVDILSFLRNNLVHNQGHKNTKVLFVTTGSLTSEAQDYIDKYKISVWTPYDLVRLITPSLEDKYFGYKPMEEEQNKSDFFKNALEAIEPGKENWSRYQKLTSDIMEYLFSPPLERPRYEQSDEDEKNRRDMIFENSAERGFWRALKEMYQAHYIVMDAKNYSDEINKLPVISIAHYLKPYGCGMFGIIITRRGAADSANHAIREQWIGNNKMIVVLNDADVIDMLKINKEKGNPEELIRKKLADFRMKL